MDPHGQLLVGLTGSEAGIGLLRYASRVASLDCRAVSKQRNAIQRPVEAVATYSTVPSSLVDEGDFALVENSLASGAVSEVRFVRTVPDLRDLSRTVSHRGMQQQMRFLVRKHFYGGDSHPAPQCDVVKGAFARRLIDLATEQESDLVLVGQPANRSSRSALARLIWQSPCTVWIVPDDAPATITRILVPIDLTAGAADTLRVALTLARRCNARCMPMHVYFNDAVVTYAGYDAVLRQQKHEAYEKLLPGLHCDGVALDPLMLVEGAKTSHVIQRVAERQQVDLIVMSTRGRTRATAMLLSSVAEQMAGKTRAPLLVIKDGGQPMGLLRTLVDPRWRSRNEIRFN